MILYSIILAIVLESVILIGSIYLGVDSNIIATSMTAIMVIVGYFITHELESSRNSKSRKLELCLDIIKSLRLLVMEPYNNDLRKKELRDKFIDSYFSFSLLISAQAYNKLQAIKDALEKFLKDGDKDKFQKVQSIFINQLRKEFSIRDEIEFETYVIPINDDEKRILMPQ